MNKTVDLLPVDRANSQEWLETNGLGGWCGSTTTGCHTRRYHGMLVAAVNPALERMVLVSKLDETIVTGEGRFELGVNNYGDTVHPNGYQYLSWFIKGLLPEFIYAAGGVQLKKTIGMVNGENTTVVQYEVLKAATPITLELLPLLAVRNMHSLVRANDVINQAGTFHGDVFNVQAYPDTPPVFIKVPGASFIPSPCWYYHFNYAAEAERGLDCREDLFSHGIFTVALKEGDTLSVMLSDNDPSQKDAGKLLAEAIARKQQLLKGQPNNELVQQLLLAADQFLVKKGKEGCTVIAGYHWFADWGRDTMIALPGLCLATGRFSDAEKIFRAFANTLSMGMLPNRFGEGSGAPEFNNVDGTLWFFIALYRYLAAGGSRDFVLKEMLPVLENIAGWHFKGTRYHIHAEGNGLLYAGEPGYQLTWMDAKIGDRVVTPRTGRPVEVQALWYNALNILSGLLELDGRPVAAAPLKEKAGILRQTFLQQFWLADEAYLCDCIDEGGVADKSLRPNQVFALSLPFPLVTGSQGEAVLKRVELDLYTPVGLRTLSPADSLYQPVYKGDAGSRDGAYHQGTAWSWLLGPYVDAIMTLPGYKDAAGRGGREKAMQVVAAFGYHLQECCIGSVSEIFDAETPHLPRGCVAQAWGVAEWLRVIKTYELYR